MGDDERPDKDSARTTIVESLSLAARARNLLSRQQEIRQTLGHTVQGAVDQQVLDQMSGIPLERLTDIGDRNVRVGALDRAGFTTLGQLVGVTPSQLARYPGVGRQSAEAVAGAVRDVAAEVRRTTAVRVENDPPDERSLALMAALLRHRTATEHIAPLAPDLGRVDAEVPGLAATAVLVTQPLRFRFARGARKDEALRAHDTLTQWQAWGHARESQIAGAETALAVTDTLTTAQLSEDFRVNSAAYYALLDREFPQLAGPTVTTGTRGLPQDLIDRVESFPLDTSAMTSRLRRYQEFGARFALTQKRVLIGDEMGLGKTIQALAVMSHLSTCDGARHFLVICPAAVMVNWMREVRLHTALTPIVVHGPDRDDEWDTWSSGGGVAITTYDTAKALDRTRIPPVSVLVADEAHYVKNRSAQRTRVVAELTSRADHVLFLSGTPMQNRLEEFRTLAGMLRPEVAATLDAASAVAGAQAFQAAAAPVYLRRNVDEVARELPEVIEIDEWEEFSSDDLAAYRDAVLAQNFMWMRRAAFDAARSAKLERLVELCEEANQSGRRVLVFSFFLDVLERVRGTLPGPTHGPITGAIRPAERQAMVDAFSTGEPGVLIAQISAGGEGLNIQAASVVILCEPQIKPSLEQQAIARAHRIGQTRRVQVHRLLITDSVDQRMLELLGEKERLFDTYIRDSYIADRAAAAKDNSETAIARAVIRLESERLGIPATGSPEPD